MAKLKLCFNQEGKCTAIIDSYGNTAKIYGLLKTVGYAKKEGLYDLAGVLKNRRAKGYKIKYANKTETRKLTGFQL